MRGLNVPGSKCSWGPSAPGSKCLWGLNVWEPMQTQTTYSSLLTHAKQLLLVTFCETSAGNKKNESVTDVRTYGRTEGQTDVKSEIVI